MGYHALLICSDEKVVRIVSQLFRDIGFEIDTASDATRAKEAMAEQCSDAIIVDCGSDEDTSLLFNNIRKSNSNKDSLTIALVEGQTGVAAAYRAGANLVLTKPINIEQAKGTLRIARGLLRKSAENSHQASAAWPKEPSTPQAAHVAPGDRATVQVENATPEFAVPVTASAQAHDDPFLMAGTTTTETAELEAGMIPWSRDEVHEPAAPASGSNVGPQNLDDEDAIEPDVPTELPSHTIEIVAPAMETPKSARETITPQLSTPAMNTMPKPVVSAGGYSAAAAAPAREMPKEPGQAPPENTHLSRAPVPAKSGWTPLTEPIKQTLTASATSDDLEDSSNEPAALSYAMPGKEATGFSRIFIGVAIVLIVAAASYLAWSRFVRKPAVSQSNYLHVVELNQPRHTSAAEKIASGAGNKAVEEKSPSRDVPPGGLTPSATGRTAPQAAAERIELVLQPKAAQPAVSPLQVSPDAHASGKHAESEDSAAPPSALAVTPAQNNLSGLMSSDTTVSKPTLAQLKISQGVSQGLLIKSVTPRYPQSAFASHRNGVVEIEATIDKEGRVVDPKVLSGNGVFNAAALEAVRQWRYKPYYLNGEPVEIRTQVTIRFKAD